MKIMIFLVMALLLFLPAGFLPAQTNSFVTVKGKNIVTPDGQNLLLRGINLGNWLVPEGYMFKFTDVANTPRAINEVITGLVGPAEARAFWKKFRDNYITREDIQFIRKAGLNSIRVPFNYKLMTPEDYPGTWLGPGFEMLDRVIEWSREAGLYVILDMHCAPGGQTGDNIDDSWGTPWLFESPESQDRTVAVWWKIAERYADEPTVIGYDLLNEPIPHFEEVQKYRPLLEPLYKRITAAIREVDRSHLIFLGGAHWDTDFSVFGPPFDSLLVYTFHKYWNENTIASIQQFLDYRDRYNVPIWLGESGENRDGWIDSCRVLLESRNIGWCFWPYKKMDATSCMVTFPRPQYYDEIVEYSKLRGANFAEKRKGRPSPEHARAALNGFLKNCLLENNHPNNGYVKALGLQP
ncbi:MAG: glycoside hydrolase family 5 protein [Calditrichia bacterium]